jgi:predicted outer membrane protein
MKKFLAIIAIASFAVACNNSGETKDATADSLAAAKTADSLAAVEAAKTIDTLGAKVDSLGAKVDSLAPAK